MQTTTEVQVLSLEKVIETKLVQNNVTEQVIKALKDNYGGMTLKSLDDKESYLSIKEAAKNCAKVRTLATKVCKEGREEAVKIQKEWIKKEKSVVGEILEVEEPLDAEIKKFDDEVERKANEEKQRKEDAFIARQQILTKMGAEYVDSSFVLGEASFERILIKESSQDVWEESIVPKFQAEYEKIEAVRIKEENERAEREAEAKRQREEFEQQQAEFKRQLDEFNQRKAETQKQWQAAELAERQKKEAEENRIKHERRELHEKRFAIISPFQPAALLPNLWDISEEEFIKQVQVAKDAFESREQEKIKRIQEEAAQKERQRIEDEQRQAEIIKQQEEAKKQEEMANALDKVKYADLIQKLSGITLPDMRSGQYRKKVAIIREKLEEILSL